MLPSKLENICSTLCERLQSNKEITEEQIHVFLNGISDTMSSKEIENLPDSAQFLSDEVNQVWNYRDLEHISRTQAFLFGCIWACFKILDKMLHRESEYSTLNDLAAYYSDKQWFFQAILEIPGIRHKDLAQKGKISPSQLSQFVSKACREGLVTYHRMGREKYYFLMDRGKDVYKKIQRENLFSSTMSNHEPVFVPAQAFGDIRLNFNFSVNSENNDTISYQEGGYWQNTLFYSDSVFVQTNNIRNNAINNPQYLYKEEPGIYVGKGF